MEQFQAGAERELTLHVRQIAWLGTAPRPRETGRKNAPKPEKRETRAEEMKRQGIERKLPPVRLPHLIEHLMEVGPVEITGMDRAAISWRELEAWGRETAIRLRPWEKRLLRRLSAAYLAESRAAEDPHRGAPWSGPKTDKDRHAEDAALRSLLG
ncbi:hypothetical protein [Sphingomonas sp. ID0503]|uniref:hypothetical protein n=1 Tax=Sphingomonas sp. ID0503 TaxID=3399691 RepID=UPI003AFB1BD8